MNKKRFLCHIIGIEPKFENIISNGHFMPMVVGERKPEAQWTADERKAANLDQHLKSLIMSVLPDDQINSVINCLTTKSTWDDLILYHEGPSDVKESRVIDLKLCYNTFKFKEDSELASLFSKLKYEENLIDSIYETEKSKSLVSIVQDFQDSLDDEKDTRSSHEYLNDLEEEYQEKALLAKSKRFFKKGTQRFSSAKATDQTECHKCDKKGHFTRDCWSKTSDEEEVSSDDEETEVKDLMALTDEERIFVGKESARNGEWTKITIKKIEEQRNNLLSKYRNLVQELNACKEQLLVLKQEKLDLLTMQHVNTEILKKNQNLRLELKELTSITETWLNSSNKVNQYNSDMSITSSNLHKSSIAEDSTLLNHDTDEVPSNKSQRNTTDPSAIVSNSPAFDYDSADESSVCNIPLLPLKKLDSAKPGSGPKTVKSILKLKSTFKAETLKGIIINEPSSAPPRGNKSSSASKNNSAPAGKLKNVKMEDDLPLAIVNLPQDPDLQGQQYLFLPAYIVDVMIINMMIVNPQHVTKNCETCGSNVHTTFDHNDIEWFIKREALQAKKVESFKAMNTPIMPPNMLGPDLNGKAVNEPRYKSMIGSQTNQTASRPDIQFSTDLYARHQVNIRNLTLFLLRISSANKQQSVALFSTKAEDVAAAGCYAIILWIKSQLADYDIIYEKFQSPNVAIENHSPNLLTGHDVLVDFTTEADPGLSAPNDSIPPQQGMDEGTKNTSYDHIFAGTDPHVLADQTKSVSEGLETVLTQPTTEKGASSTAIHGDKEEASSTIKLEDLAKLVSQIQPSFKDLDSPEDDPVIIVDESDEDEPNAETEDTSVPRSSSPRSSQIQELTNQVLILQSQKHKLELEKNKAEAEAALLKAQPSFPNVEQLNELLVKSLQTEFSKILSSHDFSSSLPTELKDLPSKFNELTEEIKGLKTQVHELEIELPKELKEIPTKLEDFTKTATSLTSQVAELKTLYLLLNVTKALNKFAEVLESTSTKAGDQSVPSAGQANTMHAEGEKDTNQATISQLFQRRAEKIAEAEKENLNQQPKATTPPTTTPINPLIITTTTQM
ncbi:retrovirus-related pol polyprotein from transposon TNT 1-94 [Tanacetum coccineum]|uniref:Retrovirus-related pol polyprotein from transposon TNT 1-94 n=1 Tax=Tanacetum coccineum TaxID=301880 RepID=A0ABQ4ZBV8_9ASTR